MKAKVGKVPAWARIETQEVFYDPDLVTQFRFDGLDGLYKLGENSFECIAMQPICYRTRSSERYGRKPQVWLDICFVNGQSKVSMIALNKQSANIMMDWLSGLLLDGIAPHAVQVVLTSQKLHVHVLDEETQTTTDDYYYAVLPAKYSFVDEERFRIVSDLKAKNIRFAPLGEVWNG